MTFNLDGLFTHKDILISREPEVLNSDLFPQRQQREENLEQMRIVIVASEYSHCPHAQALISSGDFISILNSAWKKNYDENITFKNVYDPKNGIDDLEEQLVAGPWNCIERGRTKKIAQHRAAANVLLKIIESGRHKEFMIPGRNKDEARQIIMDAMQEHYPPQPPKQPTSAAAMTPCSQQTNWIGMVNELIIKKKIQCRWKDTPTKDGPLNVLEHSHKTSLELLDGSDRTFEGNGKAKNKKMAKQIAHKEIYDQLCQIYEPNNIQMETESTSKTLGMGNSKEQIEGGNSENNGQNIQIESTTNGESSASTQIQANNIIEANIQNALAFEMEDDDEGENEEIENKKEEKADIYTFFEEILANRQGNIPNSEMLLRRILSWKDVRIEKAFQKAELKFVECLKNEFYDVAQVYLEIWVQNGPKRVLNCTFGGGGFGIEAAKNDACWQAIESIYYFADISPPNADL